MNVINSDQSYLFIVIIAYPSLMHMVDTLIRIKIISEILDRLIGLESSHNHLDFRVKK